MPQPKVESYNRSLERALRILCAFSFEKRELSLLELSRALDIPKSTIHRLAKTLVGHGFLQHNEKTKEYFLGMKLFDLGSIVFSSFSLKKVASPLLHELYSKLGRTIFLGVFQGDQVVYIDKKEDRTNPIKFSSDIGNYRAPYYGMFGHLFLSFLPDKEVDRILKKNPLKAITKYSVTSLEKLKERFPKIREQGFFIDREEAVESVTGVSAPVYDYDGKVVAAVGSAFISSAVDSAEEIKIVNGVCETAKNISYHLGSPSI